MVLGTIAKLAFKGAKKVGSKLKGAVGKGKGGLGKKTGRRSRGINLTRYTNQLIRAKLRSKIMREKLKVVNMIR